MLTHFFRFLTLCWLALCVSWMGDGVWGQAVLTFAFALTTYAVGEHFNKQT